MAKVRIPSTGYYFDWQTHTLYMTNRFTVKANDLESDAFRVYERFAEKFPNMRVVIEAPKRRASTYIPYNKMVLYISYQENAKDLIDEFNTVRQQSNAQKNPYKHVFDWFTTKFPAYGKSFKKAS